LCRNVKLIRILILALLSVTLLALPVASAQQAEKPVVQMFLFHSPDCPDCQSIVDSYIPALAEKYGEQLQIQLMNVDDASAMSLLLEFERTHSINPDVATVPEAFLADRALVGADQIRAELEPVVDELLAGGGAKFPAPAAPLQSTTAPGEPEIAPTVTPHPADSVDGAVHIMLFFSPTCGYCEHIRTTVMPPLYEKYGDKLVVREFDVSEPYNFSLEIAIEETAGLPAEKQGYVPLAVVGRYLLTNASVIELGLEEIIQEGLAEGGIPWPIDPAFFKSATEDAEPQIELTRETPATTPAQSQRIQMAYFVKAGCQECDRATYEINYLKDKFPNLDVTVFDVVEYAELNEWLSSRYGVPDEYHLTAPAIFIGEDFLAGKDMSTANIESLILKYNDTGAGATWENWEENAPEATSRIVERFKSFGGFTVVLAGLIDGLNPCAFATIVFFISYLAFSGRKGKDILLVGGAFALGVFLTYLLVGVGLYQLLQRLPFLTSLGQWVYGITAALCFILAILSLLDFFSARKGKVEEMRLRLPMKLRRRINQVIRESASSQALAGVALVTGFVISIIELACTGQVYLPTILFVLGVDELRASAFLYLLLYNVMFILPLVVVFVLAYLGTTSEQLARFINKNTAWIKLATVALFVLLGGWMLSLML
jgi:cytochrome c biogenesis protein CcdA/thiol-disulfide isomerase/thioredoxin